MRTVCLLLPLLLCSLLHGSTGVEPPPPPPSAPEPSPPPPPQPRLPPPASPGAVSAQAESEPPEAPPPSPAPPEPSPPPPTSPTTAATSATSPPPTTTLPPTSASPNAAKPPKPPSNPSPSVSKPAVPGALISGANSTNRSPFETYGGATGLNGLAGEGFLAGFAPSPPYRLRNDHPPNSWGIALPLLLVTFFGCFVFQTYQKNGNRRGVRAATHDSEGINLVENFSNARKFMSNRATDAFDRRRDPRLAAHDGSRNTDPDEDGML